MPQTTQKSLCCFKEANKSILIGIPVNRYKYWLVFHGHLRDFYMVLEMLSSHIAFIFFFSLLIFLLKTLIHSSEVAIVKREILQIT